MTEVLSKENESELILRGFTRRSFFRFAMAARALPRCRFMTNPQWRNSQK